MKAEKPLSTFALAALRALLRKSAPRQEFNSGVVGLLERRGLAETYIGATPYQTRKGDIQWLRITDEGRALIGSMDRPVG